jgi:hypothetical protein
MLERAPTCEKALNTICQPIIRRDAAEQSTRIFQAVIAYQLADCLDLI